MTIGPMHHYCMGCEWQADFKRISVKNGIEYWQCQTCGYMMYLPEVSLA